MPLVADSLFLDLPSTPDSSSSAGVLSSSGGRVSGGLGAGHGVVHEPDGGVQKLSLDHALVPTGITVSSLNPRNRHNYAMKTQRTHQDLLDNFSASSQSSPPTLAFALG